MAISNKATFSVSASGIQPRKQPLSAIIKAGLIAGTLDILAAFVSYMIKTGKNPLPILNFIASGVVGKEEAYAGSNRVPMQVLGLLLHFLIATIFAAIFYYAWPVIRLVSKNWIVTGLLYGILVWLAMNLVVVPLSSTPVMKHTTSGIITGMLILMVFVGLPIAWVISRYRATA
ncbi:DUF1440 domain-containing protein [Pseudoflavitalea sp. X16]|uniref:DUF1440 domain-containing protein n=1 Tax=Paraflavitalea devenefica TaxID=2716334 RepID=UPI0014229827|nr:DUF1440 domain-containing protein [Paraflavitalea devenefica]NII29228.1 DUF1440 domain-containing protein [Paraflavitalea devenefica]